MRSTSPATWKVGLPWTGRFPGRSTPPSALPSSKKAKPWWICRHSVAACGHSSQDPFRDGWYTKGPLAPTKDNGQADLRLVPAGNYLDLASCQMDPKRKLAFVTALHLSKHLLFGYVFRQQDYPWLMSWMNYTGDNRSARGMEFSTQPFDVSHQETVAMSPMFGTATFRWLPAKAKLQTRFLFFYARVPEGFTGIDDVMLEGGKLTILDRSGVRLVLPATRGL